MKGRKWEEICKDEYGNRITSQALLHQFKIFTDILGDVYKTQLQILSRKYRITEKVVVYYLVAVNCLKFFEFHEAKRLNHLNPDYPVPEIPVELQMVDEVDFD